MLGCSARAFAWGTTVAFPAAFVALGCQLVGGITSMGFEPDATSATGAVSAGPGGSGASGPGGAGGAGGLAQGGGGTGQGGAGGSGQGGASTTSSAGGAGGGGAPVIACGDGKPVAGELCFLPPAATDVSASSKDARGLALVDCDGDGDLDAVTINKLSDNVSAWLNGAKAGQFTFVGVQSLAVAPDPVALAVDAQALQVAVGNQAAASSVLQRLALGPGCTFSLLETVALGRTAAAVALGDWDGDTDLDVVAVTGAMGEDHAVLWTGGLALAQDLVLGGTTEALRIALGDTGTDLRPELLIAARDDDKILVLQNPGSTAFGPSTSLPATSPVGDGPTALALGDVDGDQDVDMVVVSDNDERLSVLLNAGGTGYTFVAGVLLTPPTMAQQDPIAVALGDMDVDGDLDAVVALTTSDAVSLLLNDGKGNFALAAGFPLPVADEPTDVAVGDMNLDGVPDIVLSHAQTGGKTLLTLVLSDP
jgi:hypothetical protein